jgi:hypothetical protein
MILVCGPLGKRLSKSNSAIKSWLSNQKQSKYRGIFTREHKYKLLQVASSEVNKRRRSDGDSGEWGEVGACAPSSRSHLECDEINLFFKGSQKYRLRFYVKPANF